MFNGCTSRKRPLPVSDPLSLYCSPSLHSLSLSIEVLLTLLLLNLQGEPGAKDTLKRKKNVKEDEEGQRLFSNVTG